MSRESKIYFSSDFESDNDINESDLVQFQFDRKYLVQSDKSLNFDWDNTQIYTWFQQFLLEVFFTINLILINKKTIM